MAEGAPREVLAPPRYDGLDGIRAGAMFLGLAYHATYAWLPDVAPWYLVADGSPVAGLVPVTGFLHAFRMQLFFALSGFFSHLVFERRGPRGYVVDRSRRLVVPMLAALPLVLWLDALLRGWSHSLGLMSAQYAPGTGFHWKPSYLWFLIYLFTLCALAWVAPRWKAPERWMGVLLRWPPLLLLFALPTCALLFLHPENRPDGALWPRPFELLHYGGFFAFGWWLWPSRNSVAALRRWAPAFLVAGLALGVFVFRGSLQWELHGQVLAGLVAWLMTLGSFGLAFGVKQQRRPVLRFFVESSYWVYLVHYPVVLALQIVFAQVSWPGVVEYLLTTSLTFVFALITFAALVWRTPLGPWLGVKKPVTLAAR